MQKLNTVLYKTGIPVTRMGKAAFLTLLLNEENVKEKIVKSPGRKLKQDQPSLGNILHAYYKGMEVLVNFTPLR